MVDQKFHLQIKRWYSHYSGTYLIKEIKNIEKLKNFQEIFEKFA